MVGEGPFPRAFGVRAVCRVKALLAGAVHRPSQGLQPVGSIPPVKLTPCPPPCPPPAPPPKLVLPSILSGLPRQLAGAGGEDELLKLIGESSLLHTDVVYKLGLLHPTDVAWRTDK